MQHLVLRNKQVNSLFDVFLVDFDNEITECLHEGLTFEQASVIVESLNKE